MLDLTSWPTKAEAAEQLNISVRVLERRIEQRQVEALPRKRTDGRRPETVCNPRDIERMKPPAHVMVQEKSEPLAALPIMAALARSLRKPAEPIRWLTIEEAAARSGINHRTLELAVKDQQHRAALHAWRDGRQWKISSVRLDSYTPYELPPLARKSPTQKGNGSQ